jgi:hypothetical protein
VDGYQFWASIGQSLASFAWPVAVFCIFLALRKELILLLPLLRFKYKDLEASFRLDEAEEEAEKLPEVPQEDLVPPTPEEKSKFERLADISPRAAILEMRAEIDEALRDLAQASAVNPNASAVMLIRKLRDGNWIDPQTSALLDDLRVVGNNAAHRADFQVAKEDALRFRRLADRAIQQLGILESGAIQTHTTDSEASVGWAEAQGAMPTWPIVIAELPTLEVGCDGLCNCE